MKMQMMTVKKIVKKITLNPKADDSVSEGIPEDMDITEHNPEVETCDEDEDLGSEAPEGKRIIHMFRILMEVRKIK